MSRLVISGRDLPDQQESSEVPCQGRSNGVSYSSTQKRLVKGQRDGRGRHQFSAFLDLCTHGQNGSQPSPPEKGHSACRWRQKHSKAGGGWHGNCKVDLGRTPTLPAPENKGPGFETKSVPRAHGLLPLFKSDTPTDWAREGTTSRGGRGGTGRKGGQCPAARGHRRTRTWIPGRQRGR